MLTDPEINIREIREEDGEGVSAITLKVIEESEMNKHFPIGMFVTPERLSKFLYSDKYRFGKTALINNEVAGVIWVRTGWHDLKSAVASIIIHPKYRGTGVAKKLVESIQADYPENKHIEVKVMDDNKASLRFCEKLGLEYIGNHVFMKEHPIKGMTVHDFILRGKRPLTEPPTIAELDIEELTLDHAEEISRLSNQVRTEANWGEHVTIGSFTTPDKFVEYFNSEHFVFGKASFIRGKLVGASWINLWSDWEASVLVDRDWRRAGVPAKLVSRLQSEIEEDKLVEIWIMEANQPSIKLCERLGFDKIQRKYIDDYEPLNGLYCWEFKMHGTKPLEIKDEKKKYVITEISPLHAEGIARLSKSFAEELDWGQYAPIGKMHPAEVFIEFYYSHKYIMGKVALIEDQVIAVAWLTEYTNDDDGNFWEASLLIDKAWRRTGVSKEIMYALREDIPEIKEIVMWVSEKNTASIKHCQAMGYEFRLREIVKDYHPVFDGEWAQKFTWQGVKKQK